MKKAVTVFALVHSILSVIGAVWAIKSPEQFGNWLANVFGPVLNCISFDEETME